jgi:hypothetical protein
MPRLPSPPVSQKLQETLKDYPGQIAEIRRVLSRLIEKPKHGTPPCERAIWLLEDTHSDFAIDAREELSMAESSAELEAIAQAKAYLMGPARSGGGGRGMCGLDDLWDNFQTYKEAFE